jgi:hypothetical protein
MTTNQVNYLNIGLMILSCVVAFVIPFELFLFSYAILGPLHYLTEISWLHKRQCFSPGKRDFIIFGIFALLITLPNIFPHFYSMWGPKDLDGRTIVTPELNDFMLHGFNTIAPMVFVAFTGTALMITTADTVKRVIGFCLIALIAYLFRSERIIFFAFAVFLPTLVHVFLFTGAFILVGALKSKSTSGVLSLFVFVACAVSLFLLFPNTITPPSSYAMRNYDASFYMFNQQLFDALLHKQATKDMIYNSSFGVMLTRFIAFAYTYHYLNWFSKTSVIKWHAVPRKSLIATLVIWVFSVVLYFADYRTGIMALYFLSFVHVIFEFPLNFRSFKDIGTELRRRMTPSEAQAPAKSSASSR